MRLKAILHISEPLKHVEESLLSHPTRPNQSWPKRRSKPRPGQTRGLQFPHVTLTTAAVFRHKACVPTPPSIKRTAAPIIVLVGFLWLQHILLIKEVCSQSGGLSRVSLWPLSQLAVSPHWTQNLSHLSTMCGGPAVVSTESWLGSSPLTSSHPAPWLP